MFVVQQRRRKKWSNGVHGTPQMIPWSNDFGLRMMVLLVMRIGIGCFLFIRVRMSKNVGNREALHTFQTGSGGRRWRRSLALHVDAFQLFQWPEVVFAVVSMMRFLLLRRRTRSTDRYFRTSWTCWWWWACAQHYSRFSIQSFTFPSTFRQPKNNNFLHQISPFESIALDFLEWSTALFSSTLIFAHVFLSPKTDFHKSNHSNQHQSHAVFPSEIHSFSAAIHKSPLLFEIHSITVLPSLCQTLHNHHKLSKTQTK